MFPGGLPGMRRMIKRIDMVPERWEWIGPCPTRDNGHSWEHRRLRAQQGREAPDKVSGENIPTSPQHHGVMQNLRGKDQEPFGLCLRGSHPHLYQETQNWMVLDIQFSHLMWRADSLGKTLMLGKTECWKKGSDRGWDGWMASPNQQTWVWANSRRWWRTGKPDVLQFVVLQSGTWLRDWRRTTTNLQHAGSELCSDDGSICSPGGSTGKKSVCKARDLGWIPGLGRSPEEGNGYLLQYSGLENFMDWSVFGEAKNWTWLNDFHSGDSRDA